jgi:hypothetical protein
MWSSQPPRGSASLFHRDPCQEPGSAIRRGAKVESTAEGLDPAAHGGYAHPAHVRSAEANAVVCYPHNQLTGLKGHSHFAVRGKTAPPTENAMAADMSSSTGQ